MFLEYEVKTKQVVQIHEIEPTVAEGYAYAITDSFLVGDEFEQTIWIQEVDENKNLISFSAIRNNPNAKRLLQENEQLKQENVSTMLALTDVYEQDMIQNAQREQENVDSMLAIADVYEMLLLLQTENEQLKQRVNQLEGGTI